MDSVKTIDQLYQEVKDFDVVLCNDAPLATALNNRIDVPRIGGFATTPRHTAAREAVRILNESPWNDLKLISQISKETGYDMKFVHGEVENIRTIRRYTSNVEKYLRGSSKKIYKIFKDLPTLEKVMASFDSEKEGTYKGKKVAVIGLDFFDDLDKHFVPVNFKDVDIFDYNEFTIPKIYESGNDRNMADNAIDLVTQENASDVAIILDSSGPIADAVRSSLYRKGIPFKNTLSVKDLSQIRDYLEFLTLSLSFETVKIRQIRELFSSYGGSIQNSFDEYFLETYMESMTDGTRSKELAMMMRSIRDMTFIEVCERIVPKMHRPQVQLLLEDLSLLSGKVSGGPVNAMTYAVNNISDLRHNEEIPEEEKHGVLLADCNNSVFVDRPFVIFLGMGQEWSRTSAGKDYADWETENELDAKRLQALLQQGSSRLYLVNSMKNGRQAKPSRVFDDVFRKPITSFEDICREVIKGSWYESPEAERKVHVPVPMERVERRFSKSSLNRFVTCPRQYMFGELVSTPDGEATVLGNAIHSFAEFCACYPEEAEMNMEDHVTMIVDRCAGLTCPEMKYVDRSRIRAALNNILQFAKSIERPPLDREPNVRNEDIFKGKLSSSFLETKMISENVPLTGIFDMVLGNTVLDYKTGKVRDLKYIKNALDGNSDHIEFQPMVYLALLQDNTSAKGERTFRIFYAMDNAENAFRDKCNIASCIREVHLTEMSREDFIRNELTRSVQKTYIKALDVWAPLAERMIKIGVRNTHLWPDDDDLIAILERVLKGDAPKKVLNRLAKEMSGRCILLDDSLYIMSDMMDDFKEFVRERNTELVDHRTSQFPAVTEKCKDCSFLDMCTFQEVKE